MKKIREKPITNNQFFILLDRGYSADMLYGMSRKEASDIISGIAEHEKWPSRKRRVLNRLKKEQKSTPVKMPFGKHRGKPFRKLPKSYLDWMTREMQDDRLKRAAEQELSRREQECS